MSSVQVLRDFIRKKLNAAAEEIFSAVEQTIVQYEEEISRHHKLVEIKTELPHHGDCQQLKEGLVMQNSSNQEPNSRLDIEASKLHEIKKEQEDVGTGEEEEQLQSQQESIAFLILPSDVKNGPGDVPTEQLLHPDSAIPEKQESRESDHLDLKLFTKAGLLSLNNEYSSHRAHSSSVAGIPKVSHIGKKNAVCDVCGKDFQYKSQLKKHQRVHTGEKPFQCERCGKNFMTNSHLVRHNKIHSIDKPYICKICQKGFISVSTLKSHMLIHTHRRTYSCDVCGKGCSKLSSLKVHARTHTGEKPHFCEWEVLLWEEI